MERQKKSLVFQKFRLLARARYTIMRAMFSKLKGFFSADIGIDLGTANSLVFLKDKGIVLREPSVVAIEEGSKHVLAVGVEAKRMLGRTPANIVAIRPMKSGVIADFDITQAMLKYFIEKVAPSRIKGKYFRPRVVIAVPSGITEVEKHGCRDRRRASGFRTSRLHDRRYRRRHL